MTTHPSPAFHILKATPADADEIARSLGMLLNEIMQTIGIKAFDCDANESARLARHFLETGRYVAFIARDRQGEIIGVVTLVETCSVYAGGLMGTIPEFYVAPPWRAAGIGAELMKAAISYAQSLDWKRLEVTTPPLPHFDRTLSFYEQQGFSVAGGRKMKREIKA